MDREVVVAGRDLLVVARAPSGTRHVTAVTVATGDVRWRRPLDPTSAPCEIVVEGDRAWLLHANGRLLEISLATGATQNETRLYAGEGVHPCPYPGTRAVVHAGRILLVPWVAGREPGPRALAYDLRTGRLAFESRFPSGRQASKVTFLHSGRAVLLAAVYQGASGGVAIRVLDAATGARLQEIEPSERAEDWVPSIVEGYGTVLVYGREGVAVYASSRAAAPHGAPVPAPK
jgi:outer membrane protein assembly factor BamB